MTTTRTIETRRGTSFGSLLFLLFLGLKLTGYIHWSWWWVTAPIWISWALVGAIFILALVIAALAAFFTR